MKQLRKALLILTSLAFLSGCGDGNASSSSSEREKKTVESLSEAIENAKYYKLSVVAYEDSQYVFQVYTPDFYYYAPNNMRGYMTLPNDPNYLYEFQNSYKQDSDVLYDYKMNVYGKDYPVSQAEDVYSANFMDILSYYADDFTKIDDKCYMSTESGIAYTLRNYFQNRQFGYCNYFEVDIDDYGWVSAFRAYESYTEDGETTKSVIGDVRISEFNRDEYKPYADWKAAGSKIDLRIRDIKSVYEDELDASYHACYENEEVEIEGNVASFDDQGNYYVTKMDDYNGPIGIKVSPKSNNELPSINDLVKVKGKISLDGPVAYLADATYTKESDSQFSSYFDEESITNMYGGGYYAAYMFSYLPYYGDSVYSTYAYVNSLPSEVLSDSDTALELICPKCPDSNNVPFKMQLVLPKSMSKEDREKEIANLKDCGVYGDSASSAKEITFDKFIVKYENSGNYRIKLVYGSESSIYKALTPTEKVEKVLGISGMPIPAATSYSCVKFGAYTGSYLEEVYGKEGNRLGVYFYATELADSAINKWVSDLSSAGYTKVNTILDRYDRRHTIYKKDNTYVDYYVQSGLYGSGGSINIWFYQGDLIYSTRVQEQIADNISFFDVDDFVQLDGIDDADMHYYQIPAYAGRKFEKGNYLDCVLVDSTEDRFTELRQAYIKNKGYKTYRVGGAETGTPYNYKTRGANHYVLYKNIEGTNEKIFLDMAQYPTTDYTYTGHKNFEYRIEIEIYKGTEPLSTIYDDDLTNFFTDYNKNEQLFNSPIPTVNLPSGDKVEVWYSADTEEQYNYKYYGYFYCTEAFVYCASVEDSYDAIVKGLVADGYYYSSTSAKGNVTYMKDGDGSGEYDNAYITIMKDTSRGFIRLHEGLGGVDF